MIADETKTETSVTTNQRTTAVLPPKAVNTAAVKKSAALGKEIRKQSEKTDADAPRQMYALISGVLREIIIQAFVPTTGCAAFFSDLVSFASAT